MPQNLIFTLFHLPLLTSLANHPLSSLAAVPLTPGNLGQAAAAAESEEQTLAELLEAEGLAAEPEQEVMAGYTLFEVEQDNIRHAPRSALLGVGPMNICVFTAEEAAAARSPIEWYTYDGLKRWDYSQRTLTLSCEHEDPADGRKRRRQLTFVTSLGEKICQLLSETHRDGWSARIPAMAPEGGGPRGESGGVGPAGGGGGGGLEGGADPHSQRPRYLIPLPALSRLPDDTKAPRLVRFLTEIVDDFRRLVDEIWRF